MLGFCPAHLISSEVFEDDTLCEAACGELTHDNVRSRTSENTPVPDTARLADGGSPLERAAHVPLPHFLAQTSTFIENASVYSPFRRSPVLYFPMFYHTYIGTLIEEG